jgi:sodium/hydrogen antiporter
LPSSRSPSAPMRAQSLWVGMASSPRFAGGWHSAPRLVGGAPRIVFGVIAVPIVLNGVDLTTVLYAVLSLTLVRMLPVALVLVGAGLDRKTVLFIGWFGPRGLASLVFALLAVEELGPRADPAVVAIAITVFLSVLAHGLSAAPLAARYGRAVAAPEPEPDHPVPDVPVRGLPRRCDPEGTYGSDTQDR